MVFLGSDPPPPKRLPRHFRNDDIPTDTFTPRAYQVELLDAALHRNTIVCLGSSSGNTFLSVMLIRELSDQLRSPLNDGGKRSIILVNNEGSIFYLSQVIQHHTDLCVSKFYDDDGEQFKWNKEQWSDHVKSHHIIVMSPKLFCTMLSLNAIKASQLNLVIFDECHLILGDHPYKDIMNHLKKSQDSDSKRKYLPRILGLTSSFTSKKCRDPKELESSIISLERSLLSKAETATLVISERYGLKPKELVVKCENYEDKTGISILLENILHDALDFLHDSNAVSEGEDDQDPCSIPITALCECLHILHTLGPWCADCIAKMLINQLEKIDKFETGVINKKLLHFCSTQLRMISAIFDSQFSPNYDVEELLMYTSPKVRRLVHHLRKYKPECDFMIISSADGELGEGMLGIDDSESDLSDDSDFSEDDGNERENRNVIHVAVKKETSEENGLDPLLGDTEKYLCGIVFVEDRNVALVLNKFLEEVFAWDETLCFVKSHHITGHGIKGAVTKKENGKLYRKQEDVLRKFRMQDLNLLISTSVLEEGIDVPKCNLIVKFDPPKSYKSYSQSKGRARARNAEYMVLVNESKMETFQQEYDIFRHIEKVLIERNSEETTHQTENLNGDDNSNISPPYIPNPDQPRISVTLNSAIALVNRYCAKLPSDAFTHLTPKCLVEEIDVEGSAMYKANLRLPINSPFKELVQGSPMPTVMLAKREVALRMCEALHKSGELDDTLMPVGKELYNIEEEEEEVKDWEAEDLYGEVRPGTTKRKQYYYKRLATALVDSHPSSHGNYLYSLSMVLTKPISEDQNTRGRKIYAPEESLRGFGIITAKQIPEIPKFPVYTRSGEVMISVTMVTSEFPLTEEDLKRLGDCHHFIFDNVLRLEKDPMEFKPQQSELGYIVVPLLKNSESCGHTIDWDFISKLEQSKHHVKRNILDSKREPFVFNKEEYSDAVVMPSYRNTDQPQPFYVAEIRSDLNPLSPFPSPELYETFSKYYTTKYGLTITNFEQPLLDVDHTSARLNLLTPRYMNQKGVALPTSSAETKKARRENLQQKQILVAELCEVHVFPASLWKKAVCLPTILYRINYLLVAEEMRIKISSETGIGLRDLPSDFEFEPLDFGFEIVNGKENFTSNSAVLDESKMDDTEDSNTEESPSSDKGSYSTNLSEESPSENYTKTNISDQISSSQANCDTTRVLQRRRSSLTVGNLFSSEGLQNYYKNSALCDNSDCDTDDDETSNNKKENSKEDNQSKASDSVEDGECGMNNHINIHDTKASDGKARDNISKLSNGSKADDKSINALQHDQISPKKEKMVNGESNVSASESRFMNGWADAADSKMDITDYVTDSIQDMEKLSVSDTEKDNSRRTSDVGKRGNKEDVFSGMSRFMADGKSAMTDTGKNQKMNEEKISFPDPKLSLDEDKDLTKFVGPNPCTILQAFTMSNANDFFCLERLETIGDSFLKYAITVHLYCTYPGIHEGKLSYLRSKQVSNCNLYRLGKKKGLAECMISTKFEPYENWLPPGYVINESKRKGSVPKVLLYRNSMGHLEKVNDQAVIDSYATDDSSLNWSPKITEIVDSEGTVTENDSHNDSNVSSGGQCLIPYSLQTLHSIPDKSIADCVESLIGCYLTSCGKKAALQFMHWLGLKVLPPRQGDDSGLMEDIERIKCPSSPSSSASPKTMSELEDLLIGYDKLEDSIGYKFTDRFYLLQAFTHASYHYNTVTDCYQRLEFLGDAILDYIITRHLYEDSCKYSPGVLTDLRSALVNNNIFAALAVKWDFHKYFKAISPPLFHVIEKFVARQKEREDEIDLSDEEENEEEETERVELEVPKALGDIFESLAGAIYLDSGMSLDVVWRVYYRIMKPQIDKYLKSIPKSPVRELLEMEPETAKFEKPERTLEGKIRVNVNVVGKGAYTGVGRNYRIAKSAAAKKALRSIKTLQAEGLI
ncbi:hypothetical protein FSP39_006212 [Pinctada imbricata]|uniref:ribonuclease III n=1 Tax=Pinctada imbricata TaxID=66713 RepID=A0AA88XV97_PINIB|nr:hypothetical protein FSP39_006212 [Pinctada imbricata]